MSDTPNIAFESLPEILPLFPLKRVILLPRVMLPLNVFEPRYVAMTQDVLATPHRLIGMIQPQSEEIDGTPQLYTTGCAGRITTFTETDDGRYLLTLKGICRFRIDEETPLAKGGYRQARVRWEPFKNDLIAEGDTLCREAMLGTLRAYLDKMQMFCDKWEDMRSISCEKLISTLSVVCPFDSTEKQALLEASATAERAKILQALLEHAVKEGGDCKPCHH